MVPNVRLLVDRLVGRSVGRSVIIFKGAGS